MGRFVVKIARAVFCLFTLLGMCLPASAKRLALVIGNDQYQRVEKLDNARNDARLIAGVLTKAGFSVTQANDLDRDRLWSTIDAFKGRIDRGDEVVFYFAGHGVQIGSAQLLLPTDIKSANESQVQRDGVPLIDVQDALRDARVAIFIIDACRDNPFPKQGTRTLGATRGLLPPDPSTGQIIILSAGRNQKALDFVPGKTRANGLFTWELAQIIQTPGIEIRNAMEQVKDTVDDKARAVNHAQRPSLVSDLRGSFYFIGSDGSESSDAGKPAPTKLKPSEIEAAAWETAKSANSKEGYSAFLEEFPKGRFSSAARVARAAVPTTSASVSARERDERSKAELARLERERQEQEAQERAHAEQEALENERQAAIKVAEERALLDRLERSRTEQERSERSRAEQVRSERLERARIEQIAKLKEAGEVTTPTSSGSPSGSTGGTSSSGSTGSRNAEWAARVKSAIRENTTFSPPAEMSGNPQVIFRITLSPDCTLIRVDRINSSGVPSWDQAAERAVRRTNPFPRFPAGQCPPSFELTSRPTDTLVIPAEIEKQAWEAARASNNLAGYSAFLSSHPSGAYSGAARTAMAALPDPTASEKDTNSRTEAERLARAETERRRIEIEASQRNKSGSENTSPEKLPADRLVQESGERQRKSDGESSVLAGIFSLFKPSDISAPRTESPQNVVPPEFEMPWIWPAAGRVLQSFEPGKTKGITLSGNLGDPVIAVADGKVIFSGQGPRGYGNLIIIKHPGDLLSVYAHNRAVLVKEGQSVMRGQSIAELGDTDSDRPKLHFEVRRQGRPIDPLTVLQASR